MSYIVSAVEGIAKHLHPGMLIVLESTTYPGTTEEVVQPLLEAGGPEGGRRFLPRVLARARRSGQPDVQHAQRAEGRRRHAGPRATELARRALRRRDRDDRPGQLAARRRDGEAAREHLPQGEHRPRERDRADVRPAGRRRLGSRRRGRDQAVRLHAVLPRPGPRRALHPDRSVLSVVEAKQTRLRPALHRARRPHQRRHAALRGRQDRRRAQPAPEVDQRIDGAHSRHRLQARHRRHARVAGARRHGAAAPEGRQRPVRRSVRAGARRAGVARRLRHADRADHAGDAGRGRLRRDPHRAPRRWTTTWS